MGEGVVRGDHGETDGAEGVPGERGGVRGRGAGVVPRRVLAAEEVCGGGVGEDDEGFCRAVGLVRECFVTFGRM